MPSIDRTATAIWEGSVARGRGTLSGTSGALARVPFSVPARLAELDMQTSPEELLAAAHAGCFAMALANQLTRRGAPPERLTVIATCTNEEVEGKNRIVASAISVRANAPDATEAKFREAVAEADERCPFSALIRASGVVNVTATLDTE